MALLLEKILGDLPVETFLSTHYLRTPIARAGCAKEQIPLVSWPLVDRLVETPGCDLLLVRDGKVFPGAAPRNAAQVRELFGQGYTIALRQPEAHDSGLAELGRGLVLDLHGSLNLQVYVTPAGRGSFGWHYDPEEVFIFQCAGTKTYRLRANTQDPLPLEETVARVGAKVGREQTPISEHRLTAGDWLYIPGGWWHEVGAEAESMSISVGLLPPTRLDLLGFVRARMLNLPQWRERLPPLGRAASLSDEERIALCRQLFADLAAEVQKLGESDAAVLQFMLGTVMPRRTG